jgi:hypothetical protein
MFAEEVAFECQSIKSITEHHENKGIHILTHPLCRDAFFGAPEQGQAALTASL